MLQDVFFLSIKEMNIIITTNNIDYLAQLRVHHEEAIYTTPHLLYYIQVFLQVYLQIDVKSILLQVCLQVCILSNLLTKTFTKIDSLDRKVHYLYFETI